MDNMEELILKKIDEMKEDIIKFLKQLIQIPSENPPSKWKEIAKFTASKMRDIGLKTQIKRNNVIGEIGNKNGRILIFNAHLDTVEVFKGWTKNPFGGERIEGRIYGLGSSDDKSCVAAEIYATKALMVAGVKLKGNLIVTATVDEELGGFRGPAYLLDNGIIRGDACLLGDAICDYPIGYCGGGMYLRIDIKGKHSHYQWFPDVPPPYRSKSSGINSIHKMVKVMEFLIGLQEEFNKIESKFPLPPESRNKISSINIGLIQGGTKISTVADHCYIHCAIGTIPELDIYGLKARILDYIEELQQEDSDLDITVQIPLINEPYILNKDSDFSKVVQKSFKDVYNEEREFKFQIARTDAHLFQEKGIETILIGSVREDNNVHCPDEFVYIDDLINTTKLYALTALNYLK
ncbi:MAG: M20 family metallopeptidase [Promethearchaeota archaeon]